MPRPRLTRAALLLAACAATVLAAAAPAGAKTHAVSGKQIIVDEEAGIYKMRGGLVGRWTSHRLQGGRADPPCYHGRGTEMFKGCLDRRRDRSCKGDPSGTLSFTFDYWALFASEDPASLVWGACWHPVVAGTGDFAGAQGVLVIADTPTDRRREDEATSATSRSRATQHGPARAGGSRAARGCGATG